MMVNKVMYGIRISALSAMMMLLLGSSYGAVTSQEASPATPIREIRQVDFRNFTYRVAGEAGSEVIRLRDGGLLRGDGTQSGLQRIAYGDLTGDGTEEAIILLRGTNTRISRTLDELFIYTLKDGQVVALAHFEGGRRGDYILSIGSLGSNFNVKDGLLILDQAILREGEYVPTQYYTIKYRWNGRQMVEVERSCLKPIPEGMREMG